MIALLSMTNPMWGFLIAPFLIGGIGWWLRGVVDRRDSHDPDTPRAYDWATEEDHQ